MRTFEHANAAKVTETLWTGGQLLFRDRPRGLAQLGELVDAGLTHILDLRLEWDDSMFVNMHAPAVRYTWLGIDDAGQRISDAWCGPWPRGS